MTEMCETYIRPVRAIPAVHAGRVILREVRRELRFVARLVAAVRVRNERQSIDRTLQIGSGSYSARGCGCGGFEPTAEAPLLRLLQSPLGHAPVV